MTQELDLAAHGLVLAASDLPTVSLAPEGRHVAVSGSRASYADGRPHGDVAAFADLRDCLVRFAGALAHMLVAPPPRLGDGSWRELPGLGRLVFQSIAQHDLIVVKDLVMLFSALVVSINFAIELLYGLIDPRLRQAS